METVKDMQIGDWIEATNLRRVPGGLATIKSESIVTKKENEKNDINDK